MTIWLATHHVGITFTAQDLDATFAWHATHLDFAVEKHIEVHGTSFVFIVNGDARIELVARGPARVPAGPPTT